MLLPSWSHIYAEQPSSLKATLSVSTKNQASAVLSFLIYHQEPLGIPGVPWHVQDCHTHLEVGHSNSGRRIFDGMAQIQSGRYLGDHLVSDFSHTFHLGQRNLSMYNLIRNPCRYSTESQNVVAERVPELH